MRIFTPVDKYRAISLTGTQCSLNCSHCKGRYLRGMTPVTPTNIVEVVQQLWSQGTRGLLVSGGFREDGTLPIEPYVEGLKTVKQKLDLFISAHLGLVENRNTLKELSSIVDLVDFEYIQSNEFISKVKNLKFTHEKYMEVLASMKDAGFDIVPHIYIWHPWITREEIAETLQVLKENNISRTVLLVYIPLTRGSSIPVEKVVENIEYAKKIYRGELYVGCMRPLHVKRELDRALVEKRLVERIANPYPGSLAGVGNTEEFDACCSIPSSKLQAFRT